MIEVLQEFKNSVSEKTHGLYKIQYNNSILFIVRNGEELYLLAHMFDTPSLELLRADRTAEFMELIKEAE